MIDSVALPPDQAEVFLAGDRVVIFEAGTGELWIVPLRRAGGFDATAPASLSLGSDAVVTVAPDGALFAYSPEVGEVRRVDATRSDEVDASWGLNLDAGSRDVPDHRGRRPLGRARRRHPHRSYLDGRTST